SASVTTTASDPNPKNNSSSVETYALEPPKTVQFSSSNYTVTQACTTLPITVTRRGDASGAASVDYFSDALGVTAAVTINYSHAFRRSRSVSRLHSSCQRNFSRLVIGSSGCTRRPTAMGPGLRRLEAHIRFRSRVLAWTHSKGTLKRLIKEWWLGGRDGKRCS